MRTADLHIHTHFSDGSFSPEEVIEYALRAKLSCVAITDHDTIEGVGPAREVAVKAGIEVISGIELSSEMNGRDIHMLGYCFDETLREFRDKIDEALNSRVERMKKMIEKINSFGLEQITFEEVEALAHSRAIGRPHLARVMLEKGCVRSLQEAFDKYLADDAPAYVTKFKQTPAQAIRMIKEAQGVAVMAHPMVTQMDEIIPALVEDGLDGLEVYYPNTPVTITRFYEGLAKKYDLLMTGGSDAHGEFKQNSYVGKMKIDYTLVERIKERVKARN
jgi:predicted metal-dependent phosphoesterase TrpH